MDFLWIGIGAILGANARYTIGQRLTDRLGADFPYGTFFVNVVGSLLIGIVLTLLTERFLAASQWRLLLVVGFLGSYTTFSSYTWESLSLLDQGDWTPALVYILGNNVVSLLACYGGIVLARVVER